MTDKKYTSENKDKPSILDPFLIKKTITEGGDVLPPLGKVEPSHQKPLDNRQPSTLSLHKTKLVSAPIFSEINYTLPNNKFIIKVRGKLNGKKLKKKITRKELQVSIDESYYTLIEQVKFLYNTFGEQKFRRNPPKIELDFKIDVLGGDKKIEEYINVLKEETYQNISEKALQSPSSAVKVSKKEVLGSIGLGVLQYASIIALPIVGGLVAYGAKKAVDELGEFFEPITEGVTNIYTAISNSVDIDEALNQIKASAQVVIDGASDILSEVVNLGEIKDTLSGYADVVESGIIDAKSYVSDIASEANTLLESSGVLDDMKAFLETAKGTVDTVKTSLNGAKIQVQTIIAEANTAYADTLTRYNDSKANGFTYDWNDGQGPQHYVPDFDNDGEIDLTFDELGNPVFDADSGNPAIWFYQNRELDPDFDNIASSFEMECRDYAMLEQNLASFNLIKNNGESVLTTLDNATTNLDDAIGNINQVSGSGTDEGLIGDTRDSITLISNSASNAQTTLNTTQGAVTSMYTELDKLGVSANNIETYANGVSSSASQVKLEADSAYDKVNSLRYNVQTSADGISSQTALNTSLLSKVAKQAKILYYLPAIHLVAGFLRNKQKLRAKRAISKFILSGSEIKAYKGITGKMEAS